jgi:hypothetical protein
MFKPLEQNKMTLMFLPDGKGNDKTGWAANVSSTIPVLISNSDPSIVNYSSVTQAGTYSLAGPLGCSTVAINPIYYSRRNPLAACCFRRLLIQ